MSPQALAGGPNVRVRGQQTLRTILADSKATSQSGARGIADPANIMTLVGERLMDEEGIPVVEALPVPESEIFDNREELRQAPRQAVEVRQAPCNDALLVTGALTGLAYLLFGPRLDDALTDEEEKTTHRPMTRARR